MANVEKSRATEQKDAALRNNYVYFDDWTAARPSHEWPARRLACQAEAQNHLGERRLASAPEPSSTGERITRLPVVPTTMPQPAEAQPERGEMVHVQRLSGEVLGSRDCVHPVAVSEQPSDPDCRRKHRRVLGPFDGLRIAALETPVKLYDLSLGGCFINSMYQQRPGVALFLKIDLPYEGWITVKAETLYQRDEFGYAVRFVDVSDEASARLARSLQALAERAPHSA